MTPLLWQKWEEELKEHSDREWVEFLVRGIKCGFRLGHDQTKVTVKGRSGSMYEASQHREIISKYLEEEVQGKRVWRVERATEGEFSAPPLE